MTAHDPYADPDDCPGCGAADGPQYVGDELDEPELVDEEYDEGPGR